MFKDTKNGETHSYNDGCGEPAHNDMTEQPQKGIEERFYELISEGHECVVNHEEVDEYKAKVRVFIAKEIQQIRSSDREMLIAILEDRKIQEKDLHLEGAIDYNKVIDQVLSIIKPNENKN